MPVDTVTRLIRPAELTEEVIADLNPAAAALVSEQPTLEVEDARPLESPAAEYRARHRLNEDLDTRKIPPSVRKAVVGVPLPSRAAGAALAAEQESRPVPNRLAGILRALPRFSWGAR